jgi:hypothetical protein
MKKLGTETGSLVNHLYSMAIGPEPEIGMGATICSWTDRHAFTVIDISPSGKTITLQQDDAKRIDKNGMSDTQEYEYTRDLNGPIEKARRNRQGGWQTIGGKNTVLIGKRAEHYDYSF